MKNINLKFLLTLVSVLVLTFLFKSCGEESLGEIDYEITTKDSSNVLTFQDYYNFITNDTDGSVLIENLGGIYDANSYYSSTATIVGDRSPYTLSSSTNTISYRDYYYDSSTNRSNSNVSAPEAAFLFGKFYDIDLDSLNEQLGLNEITEAKVGLNSVYMPNLISADFTDFVNEKVVEGSRITWNADVKNSNGIIIGFNYNPMSQINPNIQSAYPTQIWSGISINDSGDYTVRREDLSNFPQGATITIFLGRAGYKVIEEGGMDYTLAGLTIFRGDFEIGN